MAIPARSRSLRRPWVLALGLTILLRVGYSILGAAWTPHLDLDPERIASNALTENLLRREDGAVYSTLGVWERFDTLWYLRIAERGYDLPQASVFYPLYPWLIGLIAPVAGGPLAVALLLATGGAFALFLGLLRLLALDLERDVATRAVILLAAWPASFTLFAAYPDSIALAGVVWAIDCARRERWTAAAIAGFLAGLAKAVGAFVVVPLAVLAWRGRRARAIPALGACLLAPFVFLAVLAAHGLPFHASAYPEHWGTVVDYPWRTLLDAFGTAAAGDGLSGLNLGMLVVVGSLALAWWRRPEYALWAAAALLLFSVKHTDPVLQSTLRYVLALFPAFATLARILPGGILFWTVVAALVPFNLLLLWHFFNWSLLV